MGKILCINPTHHDHIEARSNAPDSACQDHNPDLPITLTRPDCVNCGDRGCRVCRSGEPND